MLGGVYFFLFICFLFHFLLIYIYEFFIGICLYLVLCEIKNLFLFTCIFHTCGYAFCLSVSGNIQVDSIELFLYLSISFCMKVLSQIAKGGVC